MDNPILATAEMMTRPFIEEVKRKYKGLLQDIERQKEGIPQSEAVIDAKVAKDCEELQRFLIGEEELERLDKGFSLVLRELHSLPNKESVLEDLRKAGNRLLEEPDSSEGEDFPIYDTLQEMFGLAPETFDSIYQIGSELFNEGKMEEALNVFVLLTNLNTFVFEPWLGLGSCWQFSKRYPEALHAFSMASLLDFDHPAPHLFTAQVYVQMNNKKLAKETLDLALLKMDDEQKTEYRDHIQYVRSQINVK